MPIQNPQLYIWNEIDQFNKRGACWCWNAYLIICLRLACTWRTFVGSQKRRLARECCDILKRCFGTWENLDGFPRLSSSDHMATECYCNNRRNFFAIQTRQFQTLHLPCLRPDSRWKSAHVSLQGVKRQRHIIAPTCSVYQQQTCLNPPKRHVSGSTNTCLWWISGLIPTNHVGAVATPLLQGEHRTQFNVCFCLCTVLVGFLEDVIFLIIANLCKL